jgi:putative ABC transport system ATP-binding protein
MTILNARPSQTSTTTRAAALIRTHSLTKRHGMAETAVTILNQVNLEIHSGEFVAVVGASGSGKSTLLNLLAGIDQASSGEIWVADTPIHRLDENQLATWRGRNAGVVFQFFQLLPSLTVRENILLAMDFCQVIPAQLRQARAMHLLELVDLASQAHKLPGALSGGQQQRVAVARALANDPPLILADEPTGNLDSSSAGQVFGLFGRLVEQGKTVVMVTHDNNLASRAGRIVRIADGRVQP